LTSTLYSYFCVVICDKEFFLLKETKRKQQSKQQTTNKQLHYWTTNPLTTQPPPPQQQQEEEFINIPQSKTNQKDNEENVYILVIDYEHALDTERERERGSDKR